MAAEAAASPDQTATPSATPPNLACLAPAKVNLTLHLCGQRADGYHLLDSLVVFPALGDWLEARPSPGLSLDVSGPFAGALSEASGASAVAGTSGAEPAVTGARTAHAASGANLVLRAARALAERQGVRTGAALHLVKNLPVASGIGGGSSDAAAALDLLSRLWGVSVPEDLAPALGADVPVCRAAPRPMRMQGIGERLTPAPPLPACWLVLVNPGIAVPTGAVFAGVTDRNPPAPPPLPGVGFADFAGFVGWLGTQRNDLQAPAVAICPPIGEVLEALAGAPLARMSGSGATCVALVEGEAAANALAERLRRARPRWWVAAAAVGVDGTCAVAPPGPRATPTGGPTDISTGAR